MNTLTRPRRFTRPPSVDDYARMNRTLRLAAAEALAERLDQINKARKTGRPPAWRADDYTAEEVRMAATALLPIVAATWTDPDHIKAARRTELEAADIAWNNKHPRRRKDTPA